MVVQVSPNIFTPFVRLTIQLFCLFTRPTACGCMKKMTAYPMGLPEFDPVRLTIEGGAGLDGTQAGAELLDEETAGLWMAGKEFRRDQAVGDRVGKNEKTRITCKLQNPGSGPPGREPAVSEDERKAMMAFYFKRQEELKRLAEVGRAAGLTRSLDE